MAACFFRLLSPSKEMISSRPNARCSVLCSSRFTERLAGSTTFRACIMVEP